MADGGRTELAKRWEASEHEGAVRARWDAAGVFAPEGRRAGATERRSDEGGGVGASAAAGRRDSGRGTYSIVIPPPNVTARLHLGHALNNTLQDVLVRAHRMMGFETLWLPGTDHAGIATQTVVDKRLREAGEPALADYKRMEAAGQGGREKFIGKVREWKDRYEREITDQLKEIGCSCDWGRQRFTMDDVCARAVREGFFRLFRDGLIERGKRLVNWDPVSQTALADDEVEMKEVEGSFWYMRYPEVVEDGSGGWRETGEYVTVATTRPETYLGDTAVAVNPKDPERSAWVGRKVRLPLVGRVVPVIGDDYVVVPDPESSDAKARYASGYLKVTPAHDVNDWAIGERHGLDVVNVMAPDATISDAHGWEDVGGAGRFVGLSREAARDAVVEAFREAGLLAEVREYAHAVGHSYRSHAAVEPYLSDQWYVRVTDERLVGWAQRAVARGQRSDASLAAAPETEPRDGLHCSSGGTGVSPELSSGGTGVSPVRDGARAVGSSLQVQRRHLPHRQLGGSTYFVTFRLAGGEMTDQERRVALASCLHWHGERATVHLATVMPDHVHVLLTPMAKGDGWWPLAELLHSVKSYSAHEINRLRGADGPVWQDESYDRIVRDHGEFVEKWNYMLMNPVRAGLCEEPGEWEFVGRGGETEGGKAEGGERIGGTPVPPGKAEGGERTGGTPVPPGKAEGGERTGGTPVPPGKAEGEEGGGVPGDGSMRFWPERYAKTYEAWHDGLRDWCISRQLWWGHRIPVWRGERSAVGRLGEWERAGRVAVQDAGEEGLCDVCVRGADGDDAEVVAALESAGFVRDADVLDTWFSSALWPMSTMGWPEPDAQAETEGLLERFNPTSVLCTARDIITLWVSRMVMFNRYFLGEGEGSEATEGRSDEATKGRGPAAPGRAPFENVYIHPVIQDGHGQRMSKSLGNGVDPLDIVHSHGADAMRFVLTKIATATQDVRLPVDLVCPHTGEAFEPVYERSPQGYLVASPVQRSPGGGGGEMVTAYGVASGSASPTAERPLARNTSTKFDEGRNFCTKLWNAARFTLMQLDGASVEPAPRVTMGELGVVDRWMLSRLASAVEDVEAALGTYQFASAATVIYDVLWRDFCDWYLEAIKPTVKESAAQLTVLASVLDGILRLLHPVCPFITEVIDGALRERPRGEVEGLRLARPRSAEGGLCVAGWPQVGAVLRDASAEETFEDVRRLVEAVRQVRAQQGVKPRERVTLHAGERVRGLIASCGGVVEHLAGVERVSEGGDGAAGGAPEVRFDGEAVRVELPRREVDAGALRGQLEEQLAKLDKDVSGLEKRLSNPGYVEKAPAKLVEETRGQLASKQAERDAVRARLGEL